MRVMTYNILRGGGERLPLLEDAVRAERPDILALQEANDFTYDRLCVFGNAVGLRYCAIAEGNLTGRGHRYPVAVLTHYGMRSTQTFQHCFHHAGLHAALRTEQGILSVCAVHLHPHSEKDALQELSAVIASQACHDDALICGDFNSLSQDDWYPDGMVKRFSTALMERFTRNGRLCYDVIKSVKQAGYIDAAARRNARQPTYPSPVSRHYSDGLKFRIDYVFAKPSLARRVRAARVVNDELTRKASDHYPVVVDFNF